MNTPLDFVSFEDLFVDFTLDEWQSLSDTQRKLYRDVMLETYMSLLSVHQCSVKPEVILKLEQGAGPWTEGGPNQSLQDTKNLNNLNKSSHDNQKRHLYHLVITNSDISREKMIKLGKIPNVSSSHISRLTVKNGVFSGTWPGVLNLWTDVLPNEPGEMQAGENLGGLHVTGVSHTQPEPPRLYHRIESGQQHFQYCQHGEAFTRKTVWTPKRFPKGDLSLTFRDCGKACDGLAPTAQELTLVREEAFECNVCGKMFYVSKLTQHLKIYKGEECYKGRDPEPTLITKPDPTKYHRRHANGKPYGCNEDMKFFAQKSNVSADQRIFLGKKTNLSEKTFPLKSNYIVHQIPHMVKKSYKCNRSAYYINKKLDHHTQITQPCEKSYECNVCGKSFNHSSDLCVHHRTHPITKPYKSKEWKKSVSVTSDLTGHHHALAGEGPPKCKVCGKTFTRSSYLNEHHRIHTGEKPYNCPVCGKAFCYKSNLYRHQKDHTGARPFKCDICGKTFNRTSYLSEHQRTHTGEKPYDCKECRKSFSQWSSLRAHERIHTGIKPYECEECRKTFRQLSSLQIHQRIHTGEKPHQCSLCGKAFCRVSNLYAHQRTHTGERPYECNECWKMFKRKAHLIAHQGTHKKETL